MKETVYTDKNGKETGAPMEGDFPFWFANRRLSDYYLSSVRMHWHQELEIVVVTEGRMECQMNENRIDVGEGGGLFVNTNVLHAYRQAGDSDCGYFVIRVSPTLMGGAKSRINERYVNPILCCGGLPFLALSPEVEWQGDVLVLLSELARTATACHHGYELAVQSLLLRLWHEIFLHCEPMLRQNTPASAAAKMLAGALRFIQNAYPSKISLADIAAACHCSRSECCRLFKKVLRQSPMEYVIDFRIRQSLPLILNGGSITEVAEKVGFSGSSYFAEAFRKRMGCTPTEYRQSSRQSGGPITFFI